MYKLRVLLAVLIAAAGFPLAAAAQTPGTISGQVVDAATGQPLAGAQVVVRGTTLRMVTNAQGQYRIGGVSPGRHVVAVSQIGRETGVQTVTVTTGGAATANFRLGTAALALDELVVTGTAGNQTRRAQPAVVTTVQAADVVETQPVSSVSEVLGGGRVAGLSVTQSSGSAGTAQAIRIRGASSISLSNEPIVFIDGIRADSRLQGGGVGGQGTSRLNDINPEDIESIEVIKGPAASTLYGADASAGVIQIFTKRGRAGAGRFTQTVSLEYHDVDPNFSVPDNFNRCTAADTVSFAAKPDSVGFANPLCAGRAIGTLVQDNPLVREGAFRNGSLRTVNYSGRGGGQNFGYFVSLGLDDEEGTLPGSALDRRSGRVNFNFLPTEKLSIDAGFALVRVQNNLPQNDNNGFGFLGGGLLGNPLTRRTNGTGNNGFFGNNRNVGTIQTATTELVTVRSIPNLTLRYTPVSWFINRITAGADLTRGQYQQLFPRNIDQAPFGAALSVGDVFEQRRNNDVYTLDYLGTLSSTFGADEQISGDLSFGAQAINIRNDALTATGRGLSTNEARVVSAAATKSGDQDFAQTTQLGYLTQGQLGFRNKLFVQAGFRVDRFSSFGAESEAIFLPKLGASYVLSEEPFFSDNLGFVNTLRLRAAYGTTGRAPTAGAALETFSSLPFATLTGTALPGVVPLNRGTLDLRPERGKEFEGGFDAGFFGSRVSMEVTYFNKVTTDLLLRRPLPVSEGFQINPFENLGEVVNRGVEWLVSANVFNTRNFGLDLRVSGNTLHNEIVDLGTSSDAARTPILPFGTLQRFTEGRQVAAFHSLKIRSVDLANNRVIVSDTVEFIANSLPTYEGSFGGDLTLFRNLRIGGLLDWKGGHSVYNNTDRFRETQVIRSPNRLDTLVLSREERLRRYGDLTGGTGRPAFVRENGASATVDDVTEMFIQKADFVKLREISATLTLPSVWAKRFGAQGASFTVAGRNLKTWTDYPGFDPEVISGQFDSQFDRSDFLTVPPARRVVAKVNLTF